MLYLQGVYAHKIADNISQDIKYSKKFKRSLAPHDGPFKDTLRCAPRSHFYAYTDRSNVSPTNWKICVLHTMDVINSMS